MEKLSLRWSDAIRNSAANANSRIMVISGPAHIKAPSLADDNPATFSHDHKQTVHFVAGLKWKMVSTMRGCIIMVFDGA